MTQRTAQDDAADHRRAFATNCVLRYMEAATATDEHDALADLLDLHQEGPLGFHINLEDINAGDYIAVTGKHSFHEGLVEYVYGELGEIAFRDGSHVFPGEGAVVTLLATARPSLPTEVGTIIRATRIKGQRRDIPLALAEAGPFPFSLGTQWQGMNGKGAFTAWVDGRDIEEWEVLFTPPSWTS